MKARDLLYETASALDANRSRSALTILGIVIGIAAVIAMTALIGGVRQALFDQLGLGRAQVVYISAYAGRGVGIDDVDDIAKGLPDYEHLTATASSVQDVIGAKETVSAYVSGVEPVYFQMMDARFVQGSSFTDAQNDRAQYVCVVEESALRELFGDADADAVGKTITIGKTAYTVVGVMEGSGTSVGMVTIYAPLRTVVKRINGYDSVDMLLGYAREGVDMDALTGTTSSYLCTYLGIDEGSEDAEGIQVTTAQEIIDQVNATMASFQALMTAVASISLLVGGIGIMNMMLTNVTERIREIGLRKALGARSSDITAQFLIESVTLCLIGGIIGTIVGFLGAFALTSAASSFTYGDAAGIQITPVLDVQSILLAAGTCIAIGVIFGYSPARRAARLNPVDSLHYQ